jgi:hypothetical protein
MPDTSQKQIFTNHIKKQSADLARAFSLVKILVHGGELTIAESVDLFSAVSSAQNWAIIWETMGEQVND